MNQWKVESGKWNLKLSVTDKYYVAADAPFDLPTALGATFGGIAIPVPLAAYSIYTPNCRARRIVPHWISPWQKHVSVTFEDPTGGSDPTACTGLPARIGDGDRRRIAQAESDSAAGKPIGDYGGTESTG